MWHFFSVLFTTVHRNGTTGVAKVSEINCKYICEICFSGLFLTSASVCSSISSNPWSSAVSGDILGSHPCSPRFMACARTGMQSHFALGFSPLANLFCRYSNLFRYIRVSTLKTF